MAILILFFFLLLLIPGFYSADDCRVSACDYYGLPIRFPFQLSPQQPKSCGYPGFNVHCNSQRTTVLNLPSGEFLVRSINYRRQVIKLYDPKECLPVRLQELNLSGSPFQAAYYRNYTFLSCPPEFQTPLTTITCLSNSTSIVVATPSLSLVNSLTTCKVMYSSLIPVSRRLQTGNGFSSDFPVYDDLELNWSIPNCNDCEENGGLCHLTKNTSGQPTCSTNSKSGAVHVIKIIALCVTVPVVVTSFIIATFICFTKVPEVHHQDDANALPSVSDPQGLDESTIDSYTKVIIGESRRLPAGPNDITCPICLSDYHANETLKCIPECQHCFHSECIDEWLRRKGTCPVCRNSPSPAHVMD